ncbi:hypothetical protein SAMN05444682_101435 [Parapedobacter indicus]|uniref:Uncharacterized protein n=2 Tax=Parapedobacter indicus TaxID=1477437 RepID=A0A1I3DFD2_9SPHI|nr:hypothetical protein SAMN05444682_101435 [Parapedobacter indicus]
MVQMLRTYISLPIFVACLCCAFCGRAQPTPGKEKIVIDFPGEYRWKSTGIPKDTKGIRGTAYSIRGSAAEKAPVKTVTVTTIDRRYYPMKALGTPEEKWEFEKAGCPEASLDIVDKKTVNGRTSILFVIKATRSSDETCGSTVLLTYVAEGPTALHTVELVIPQEHFTPELQQQWRDALLQSQIE